MSVAKKAKRTQQVNFPIAWQTCIVQHDMLWGVCRKTHLIRRDDTILAKSTENEAPVQFSYCHLINIKDKPYKVYICAWHSECWGEHWTGTKVSFLYEIRSKVSHLLKLFVVVTPKDLKWCVIVACDSYLHSQSTSCPTISPNVVIMWVTSCHIITHYKWLGCSRCVPRFTHLRHVGSSTLRSLSSPVSMKKRRRGYLNYCSSVSPSVRMGR